MTGSVHCGTVYFFTLHSTKGGGNCDVVCYKRAHPMLSTGLCLLGCNLRAQSMLLASVSKVHSTPVVAVGYTVTPMRSVGTQFSWWCCMGTKFIHGASWVHSASVVSVGFTIHQLCQLSTQRTSSMTVIAPQCSWKARHSLFIQFNVSY